MTLLKLKNNKKVLTDMNEKKIVSISLFSGAGGLDVASFLAGVPVVSSTDFDSDCIKTLICLNILK